MQPSFDDHVTRKLSNAENTIGYTQAAPYQVPQYPSQRPAQNTLGVTDRTCAHLPTVTTKLISNSPITTARLPTIIPATKKRARITPTPRRYRPAVLISVILSSVVILTLATLFVAPLDNGQQQKSLFQTIISNAISTAQFNNISPAQQLATPTATPALLTNEGYCGGTDIWGSCATAVTSSGTMGTGKMQSPLQGAIITQVFANPEYQQWCGCWRPHTGIDLAAAYGTPVMAADSGQVIWTGWDWSGLGWAVKINHGHYIATIYGHLARFIVNVGQNVTKGQVIAYEGSTGASTGPHVHFMVLVNNIWVDPANYAPLP